MPIEIMKSGTMVATGDGVNLMRMAALLSGLRFEIRCPGMRLHRGPKCSTRIKKEFGLKGSPMKLYAQFEKIFNDASAKVTRIHEVPEDSPEGQEGTCDNDNCHILECNGRCKFQAIQP